MWRRPFRVFETDRLARLRLVRKVIPECLGSTSHLLGFEQDRAELLPFFELELEWRRDCEKPECLTETLVVSAFEYAVDYDGVFTSESTKQCLPASLENTCGAAFEALTHGVDLLNGTGVKR